MHDESTLQCSIVPEECEATTNNNAADLDMTSNSCFSSAHLHTRFLPCKVSYTADKGKASSLEGRGRTQPCQQAQTMFYDFSRPA